MSGITLKIDKGQSSTFSEIIGLLQSFPGLKECKKHYSVKLTEEDVFRFRNELDQIMQLLPQLREKEWFDIPAYGTDEWANWMIDLHKKKYVTLEGGLQIVYSHICKQLEINRLKYMSDSIVIIPTYNEKENIGKYYSGCIWVGERISYFDYR